VGMPGDNAGLLDADSEQMLRAADEQRFVVNCVAGQAAFAEFILRKQIKLLASLEHIASSFLVLEIDSAVGKHRGR